MLPGIVTSDSELVGELISRAFPASDHVGGGVDPDLERALLEVLPRLEGAFSFGIADATHLVGVRDPNGFRPLCLGRLDAQPGAPDGGWVIA